MANPVKERAKALGKNIQSPFLKINLLIQKEKQLKLHLRLFRWVLSSGRFIVIFVELLTIGAFIYRYKLDTEILDLQDKIKAQIPYIKSLRNEEIALRQIQFQLATIRQVREESPNFAAILARIATLTPQNIKLTNITLDRAQSFPKVNLTISGQTPSNLALSTFIKTLQKEESFEKITLTNISFEGQTVFTITGALSEKGAKSS